MTTPSVGIIGTGFVGGAVLVCFKQSVPVLAFDPKYGLNSFYKHEGVKFNTEPYATLTEFCKVIFVCVPTPMKDDGAHDSSIVDSVVKNLNAKGCGNLVVLKSTVLPGTTEFFSSVYKNLRFCFNPEFLREKTAREDFSNQQRVILGANGSVPELEDLYAKTNPSARQIKTDSATAEMLKYFTNCFLAVKVAFGNEMYEICRETGVNYDEVTSLLDDRIGESHLQVPGPDGEFGFGGSCFPKDLNALIRYAEAVGVKPTVMQAAWDKNREVRP